MLKSCNIKRVSIDLTENCNASCPMCARILPNGELNPAVKGREIDLSSFKKILPKNILQNLERIKFCGTYGDAIAAKDCSLIIDYVTSVNPKIRIKLNTNGSLRTTQWWTDFAKYFQSNKSLVTFDLDGLEDTHSLYRRNTSWKKIIKNAEAFINAGGQASWAFLVFKHNEHQVDEAHSLAESMGFKKFTVKKTKRFFSSKNMKFKNNFPVYKNGAVTHYLEAPENDQYAHPSLLKWRQDQGKFEQDFENSSISCKSLDEKSLFISAEGLVFPCCWFAGNYYPSKVSADQSEIQKFVNLAGGKDEINSLKRPISEILDSPFFKDLPEKWNRDSIAAGKPFTCSRVCGNKHKMYKNQFEQNVIRSL